MSQTHSIKRNMKELNKLLNGNGVMLNKFHHITKLYEIGDHDGILLMYCHLNEDIQHASSRRYHKFKELINYCLFLDMFRGLEIFVRNPLAKELIDSLNLEHELGRSIKKKVSEMCGF